MLAEDAIKAAIKDYKINIRFFTFAVCKVFYYSVHPTSAFSARGALTTRFVHIKMRQSLYSSNNVRLPIHHKVG